MRCVHQGPLKPMLLGLVILPLMIALFPLNTAVAAGEGSGPAPSGQQNPVSKDCNPDRKTYTIPSINYAMVYIPAGTFLMGSPLSEKGRYDDEKRHEVQLTKGFYMGVTEITREQWQRIMGNKPSQYAENTPYHPVDQVSWNDCRQFITALNRLEKSRRYRLPSEAEWEYACRAGSMSAFTTGDITQIGCEHDRNLNRVGWYCGNTGEKTQPVAKKEPNAWDIYDMHGNAWEWCQDWYGPYLGGQAVNPKGPDNGTARVFRGGGWGMKARSCRSAFRDKYAPEFKCKLLGFRLVREAGE